MAQQIQLRRSTAAAWTAANPVLAQGEVGVETDTGRFKFGDGSTVWMSLDYAAETSSDAIAGSIVDAKGDLIVATANDTVARLPVGTNDQVLTADSTQSTGVKWAAAAGGGGASGVLDAMNSTQQVINTTTETTLATLAVPAGAVDTADTVLRITTIGNMLNNTGTTNHIYRLKIDGTTVMTMTKSFTASGNLAPWVQRWTIACPTNATQRVGYEAIWGTLTNGSSGVAVASLTGQAATGFANTSVDMSGAHNITFTVELATAAANVYDNLFSATLEKSTPL
jgi:hypothetical protein